jgi:hypothetical protein
LFYVALCLVLLLFVPHLVLLLFVSPFALLFHFLVVGLFFF